LHGTGCRLAGIGDRRTAKHHCSMQLRMFSSAVANFADATGQHPTNRKTNACWDPGYRRRFCCIQLSQRTELLPGSALSRRGDAAFLILQPSSSLNDCFCSTAVRNLGVSCSRHALVTIDGADRRNDSKRSGRCARCSTFLARRGDRSAYSQRRRLAGFEFANAGHQNSWRGRTG
jgi:hypothetical protein